SGAQPVTDPREGRATRDPLQRVRGVETDRVLFPVDAGTDGAVGPDDVVAVGIRAPEEALIPGIAPVLGTVQSGAQTPDAAPCPGEEAFLRTLRLELGIRGAIGRAH